MTSAEFAKESIVISNEVVPDATSVTIATQVVKQVNFGPLESKRYFAQVKDGELVEVTDQWLVNANFQKLKYVYCDSILWWCELLANVIIASRIINVGCATSSSKSMSTRRTLSIHTIGVQMLLGQLQRLISRQRGEQLERGLMWDD
jgi:hypothetical protein